MKKIFLTLAIVLLSVAAQAQLKIHDDGHVSLACLTKSYGVQAQPGGYTYFHTQSNQQYGWATKSIANVDHQKHWIVTSDYVSNCSGIDMFYVYGNGTACSTHHYTITPCFGNDSRDEPELIDGEAALSTIRQLKGCFYYDRPFMTQEDIEENEFVSEDAVDGIVKDLDKRSVGLSVSNFEEVFPDAVRTDPEARLCIDYNAVITMLVEAVKQQQTEIEFLRNTLEENGLIEPQKP